MKKIVFNLYTNNKMFDKKFRIFIFHIIVSVFLGYLSYMIINDKKIRKEVGIILFITSIFVISVHSYMYFFKETKDTKSLRGISFNPKDKKYDSIGGIGGIGLI